MRKYITDVASRKVIYNLFYVSSCKGLSLIISFLTIPILLNCLDENIYGIWLALLSIISWISLFDIGIGNGLKNKLIEYLSLKDYTYAKKLVSTAYLYTTVIFGFVGILCLLILPFISIDKLLNVSQEYAKDVNIVAIIVIIALSIKFIFQNITPVLIAVQKIGYSSFIDLVGQLLAFIGILVLYWLGIKSLIYFSVVILYIPIIVQLLFTCLVFRTALVKISPSYSCSDKKCFKDIFSLGINFFIIQIAAIVIFQTNNFLIANNFTPQDVTRYNIVYKFFTLLSFPWGIIMSTLWPNCTEAFVLGNMEWIKKAIKYCLYGFVLTLVVALLMLLSGEKIIYQWLHKNIDINWGLLVSMMVFTIIGIWNNIWGGIVGAIGKVRLGSFTTIVSATLFFPLFFVLKKLGWGVDGAVWSMIICISLSTFISPLQTYYFVFTKKRIRFLTNLLS